MDPSSPSSSPSLKHKLRSSICFSCCFRGDRDADDRQAASLIRSSSAWIRSKAPEIGTFVSRMAHHHHRRRNSGDFRYDPLDYALNFDDGGDADEAYLPGDLGKYRNFSSRLPASPPPPPPPSAVAV